MSMEMMMVIVGALAAVTVGVALMVRRRSASASERTSVASSDAELLLGTVVAWNRNLRGVEIFNVRPGGAAAGILAPGDVITHYSLDEQTIRALRSVMEFREILTNLRVTGGGDIFLFVMRETGDAFWVVVSISGRAVVMSEAVEGRLPEP